VDVHNLIKCETLANVDRYMALGDCVKQIRGIGAEGRGGGIVRENRRACQIQTPLFVQ
jgi:hypothetical protein